MYWGEQYIPSGLSAVLFATHPFFVMLFAHVAIATEPIALRRLVGVGLGFVGVMLIFQDESNVSIKRWGSHLHPYHLTALPMTYAAAALFVVSWLTEDRSAVRWTGPAMGSVLYLAIVGSVAAFSIYYTLLRQFAVSTLAFVTYIFPVVALVLGYALLGETLEVRALVGAPTTVIGIAVATRAPSSNGL